MSAYIEARNHINYLVRAAMEPRYHEHCPTIWMWQGDEPGSWNRGTLHPGDYEEANRVGQMLWDENIKSVSYRYPNEPRESLPGPTRESFIYEFQAHAANPPIEPIQTLKACDGYEYQSCEHPGWHTSEAKAFIDSLRRTAWQSLPGYGDAKWEL